MTQMTKESIENKVEKHPEGPIVLWHYANLDDFKHKHDLALLRAMFPGPAQGILEIGGYNWQIAEKQADESGGFAILERVTVETIITEPRKDFRQFWLDGLARNGWLKADYHPAPVIKPRPVPEYDFSQEEGDVL